MAGITSFKDLDVWKRSMDLAVETYQLTSNFPAAERYGLVSQINRSAVSIPSNIAEGHGRGHRKEFVQFLYIAYGSLNEFQTQLLLSEKLGFVTREHTHPLFANSQEIGRMLNGLIRSLSKGKIDEPVASPADP